VGSLACNRQIQAWRKPEGEHGFIPGCFGFTAPPTPLSEASLYMGQVPVNWPRLQARKIRDDSNPHDPTAAVPMAKAAFRFTKTPREHQTGALVIAVYGKGGIG